MDVMDAVNHKIVSETEWVESHKAFLAKEKELTRQRDELSRQRRELPWVKVAQEYIFDGPNGRRTLADLFDGRSQLIVYHFMFGPGWAEGCPSCSMSGDHMDSTLAHLVQRDVTLMAVSVHRSTRYKPSKSAWGGVSRGYPPSAPTSTVTTTSHSPKKKWQTARPITTSAPGISPPTKPPG